MPRIPKFTPRKAGAYWQLNIPAKFSETGSRSRPTFKTRDAAKEFAAGLKESLESYGRSSSVLRPAEAEEALAALRLLEGTGANLIEAARHYLAQKQRAEQSCTLGEAAREWLMSANIRPTTFQSYKETVGVLKPLAGKVLAEITARDLEAALKERSGRSFKLHHDNARTLWRWAARKGWCDADEYSRVESPARVTARPIRILTIDQVKALLTTAEKHDPRMAGAYAVLLYAGIRQAEGERLTWGAFNEDGLRVTAEDSKTHVTRFIPFSDTLRAWVKVYGGGPDEPILPPNWTSKDNQMRGRCGWNVFNKLDGRNPNPKGPKWPRNALRKTHASAEVAIGTPVQDLVFCFGHGQAIDTLRRHYAGAMTRRDAIAFYSIGPKRKKIKLTRAA